MRRLPAILVIAVALLLCAFSNMPDRAMESLRLRANKYRLEGNADSCIACLRQLVGLWDGSDDEKVAQTLAPALCDLGAMQAVHRDNYLEAFRNTVMSRDMAQRHGLDRVASLACLNLANIYSAYGDVGNTVQSLRTAMTHGTRAKDQSPAIIAFRSLITETITEGASQESLREAVAMFDSISPKTTDYGKGLVAAALAKCWLSGDIDGSIAATRRLLASATSESVNDEKLVLGTLLARAGHQREATDLFLTLWDADSVDYGPVRLTAARRLIDLYTRAGLRDSTLLWHQRYQALNDSLYSGQNYGLLRDVGCDIDQAQARRELEAERDSRNRALAWLWIVLGFVVVLGAGAVVILRQNRELRLRNQALFQKDTELLRSKSSAMDPKSSTTSAKPLNEQHPEAGDSALMAKIRQVMEDEAAITSQDFSLTTLAHLCGVSVRTASAAINQSTGDNFSTLLANARVRLASLRLRDPGNSRLTIEAVAHDLGFQSRSNFASQFRRVTGLNPSEYRRLALISANADAESAK